MLLAEGRVIDSGLLLAIIPKPRRTSMNLNTKLTSLVGGVVLAAAATCAQAAPTYYTNEAAFSAAVSGAGIGLSFEGFESGSTSFAGGHVSCTGSAYCSGWFGARDIFLATEGTKALTWATPDQAVFNFDSPINAFGVDVLGIGDVAPITLRVATSSGNSFDIFTNYSGSYGADNRLFAGIVDLSDSFVSVTFSGNNSGDGVWHDRLRFGAGGGVVPEPASLALFGLGLLGLGFARKKITK